MKDFIKQLFKKMYVDKYEPSLMELVLPNLLILYILIKLGNQ